MASDAEEPEIREAIMVRKKVKQHLAGRELVKFILVPGRLANLVTRPAS